MELAKILFKSCISIIAAMLMLNPVKALLLMLGQGLGDNNSLVFIIQLMQLSYWLWITMLLFEKLKVWRNLQSLAIVVLWAVGMVFSWGLYLGDVNLTHSSSVQGWIIVTVLLMLISSYWAVLFCLLNRLIAIQPPNDEKNTKQEPAV